MKLKDIKNINQRIYELDTQISRNSKVIFVSALIFCLTENREFQNVSKLTNFINFTDEETRPIDQLLTLTQESVNKMNLQESTYNAVMNSLRTISGVNTNLDRDRKQFQEFISDFISKYYPAIETDDLFLETLYMEIDKKASDSNKGIVLTPIFIAQLMVDLSELDYKEDIVADLCCGTGLFSLLSYSTMLSNINKDYENNIITKKEYDFYCNRLQNSIIANDVEPKMVTLCLANFALKKLNKSLLYSKNTLELQKSNFKTNIDGNETKIQPTKGELNPPYEDKYKPVEIILQNLALIKDGEKPNKLIVIVPPQKFGKKKDVFSKILNISTLESVIKTQDDLFIDSGKSQPASIFIFNTQKAHNKDDIIHYYDFTDTGYVYLKDSGLVDKNNTYSTKKQQLLSKINNPANDELTLSSIARKWSSFYEANRELEISATIDPSKIKANKEEADITLENIIIKKMLKEKQELINSVNNNFVDEDNSFENYILDILSEE